MPQRDSATAFAPAAVGNVAVGFDVLGCAFGAVGDRVRVTRTDAPGVHITDVTGLTTELPRDPEENTATVGLLRLIEDRALGFGFEVEIEKGIPLGAGMGGSAASAVAAIRAANALLDPPLPHEGMLRYALAGETVASGAPHGDNVVPSLYGGLVLTRALDPLDVVPIPAPSALRCVVVRPHFEIKTRDARAVLPDAVPMPVAVQQSANLAALVAGCYQEDPELISRALDDVMVEPHRATLIPGFYEVQRAAREAGALGGSLSGAGPSCFAWCWGVDDTEAVSAAMQDAFARHDLASTAWVAGLAEDGARLVDDVREVY